MLHIRPFVDADWPSLWPLLHDTFASGDTYAFDPRSDEADIKEAWIKTPAAWRCPTTA